MSAHGYFKYFFHLGGADCFIAVGVAKCEYHYMFHSYLVHTNNIKHTAKPPLHCRSLIAPRTLSAADGFRSGEGGSPQTAGGEAEAKA